MVSIDANPRRDRQLSPGGPVLLWRDGGPGGREGLLVVLQACPFPTCPDRHVDLEVYRLTDSIVSVEVDAERAWAVGSGGEAEALAPAFWASVDMDEETLDGDPDASPELLAWLDRELDGELMAVVKQEFGRARARGQALLRRPAVRARPRVGRNDPCPCGSGRKYKRCCAGAA
jgi:hypothetical protein